MQPQPPNHDEFLSLLESRQRQLLKVCWVYSRNWHDRNDLLQEITSRLWLAFDKYDRSRPFATWMFRVALNVAIDFRRRQTRWGQEAVSLDTRETTDPAEVDEDQTKTQQLGELHELLEQQTDSDRALLLLYLEGHSHREIGIILGMSETNVGTRLNRLKKSLRQTVQDSSDQLERE